MRAAVSGHGALTNLRQEDKMAAVLKTSLALGLILTFSAGSYPAFSSDGSVLPQPSTPTPKSAFGKAKALARIYRLAPALDTRGTETDGLGRNDDDCKFGCTDH
jgi:hypothetical protein